MDSAVKALIAAERVVIEPCGHARIPKLAIYQKPGHPYYAVRDEHKKCQVSTNSSGKAAIASNSASEGKVSEGNRVNEENLTRARAHEEKNGGPSLKERVGGDYADIVGKKS